METTYKITNELKNHSGFISETGAFVILWLKFYHSRGCYKAFYFVGSDVDFLLWGYKLKTAASSFEAAAI